MEWCVVYAIYFPIEFCWREWCVVVGPWNGIQSLVNGIVYWIEGFIHFLCIGKACLYTCFSERKMCILEPLPFKSGSKLSLVSKYIECSETYTKAFFRFFGFKVLFQVLGID